MSSVLLVSLVVMSPDLNGDLQAAIASQDWQRTCAFVSVSEWSVPKMGRFRQTNHIRRDGKRLDIASQSRGLDQADDWGGNVTHRVVNNGTWYFGRTTSNGRKRVTGVRSASEIRMSNRDILEGNSFGFQLDGYFTGNDGKTLAEILLDSGGATASSAEVNGKKCTAISGKTKYGEITICIDPESGHAIRSARVSKTRDDIYSGTTLGEHNDTSTLDSRVMELTVDDVAVVGDFFIPTAGTVTVTETGAGGTKTYSTKYSRSDFELKPQFEGTDAFQMDFEDGAVLADYDQSGSPIAYVWNKGEMTPEGVAGLPDAGLQKLTPRNTAVRRAWWLLAGNVLVICVLVGWWTFSRRSRTH